MYKTLMSLKPYFFSLREINNTVVLDVKLPINWVYNNEIINNNIVSLKLQDKDDRINLISLIAPSTEEGFDNIITVINNIIKYNKEEEEKVKLFNEKMTELKQLFENMSLDKLKEISLIKNEE